MVIHFYAKRDQNVALKCIYIFRKIKIDPSNMSRILEVIFLITVS